MTRMGKTTLRHGRTASEKSEIRGNMDKKLIGSGCGRAESPLKTNRFSAQRGFTLVEMLTVVGILGILMASAFTGLSRAQRQARIAKAQTEVRQLVNAWLAYEAANDDWPVNFEEIANGDPVPASEQILGELLGKNGGKGYIQAPIRNGFFRDPWGTPYHLKIKTEKKVQEIDISDTFFATVTFPNRNRPPW